VTRPIYIWQHKVNGEVIGEIHRLPKGKGKQDFPHYKWNGKSFDMGGPQKKPYPLLGLDSITDKEKPVIICEGQKKQLIWESLGYQCITSLFGSGSAQSSDWTAVANTLTFWIAPDNDKAGTLYAQTCGSILKTQNPECSISLLKLPDLPPKGDLCDWLSAQPESAGWDGYTPLSSTSFGEAAIAQIHSKLKTVLKTSLSEFTDWETTTEWSEPHELAAPISPVTRMTMEMVPKPLQPWVRDTARRMQCPLEYVAIAITIVAGASIGAACSVRPKQKDDWTEYGNLWGFICGPPGTLKTPALLEATLALKIVDDKLAAANKESMTKYEREHKDWETANKNSGKRSKYVAEQIIEEPPQKPACRRFIVSDATVEALGAVMKDNPRGLLMYIDELNQLVSSWNKPEKESDRAFYLSAWSGAGRTNVDRIMRGALRIDNMCLSLLGGIQPDKLRTSLVRTTDTSNDGLLQRFQLAIYLTEDECQSASEIVDEYPDNSLRRSLYSLIGTLADSENFGGYGAENDKERVCVPFFRYEEGAAQQEFYRWLLDLEKRIKQEENPYMQQHLSKFRKLCPTLALIFHLLDCVAIGTQGRIQLETMRLAAAWCGLLEQHARRIYNICAPIELRGAHELGRHIMRGKLSNPFAIWQIQKMGWRGLQKRTQIEEALKVLQEYNWVRKVTTPPGPKGGSPKIEFWLNPKLEIAHDGRMVG
jgi:hypothetical protein